MAGRNPFGIHTLKQYPKAYRHAREVARTHGYALTVHGSRTYDLDLVAAPWAEPCSSPEELAVAIAERLGWYLLCRPDKRINIVFKPHGRMAFLIYGPKHAHIDLSVMPRSSGVKLIPGEMVEMDVSYQEVLAWLERVQAEPKLGTRAMNVILSRIPVKRPGDLTAKEFGRVVRLCKYFLDGVDGRIFGGKDFDRYLP